VAVYLLLMGYTFTAVLFLNRTGELVRVFFQAAVLFLLIVPVVTMRLFAEERRNGTLELLLTSPVREVEIVLAKFVAGLTLPALMLALTASYAIVLGLYGDPDWGRSTAASSACCSWPPRSPRSGSWPPASWPTRSWPRWWRSASASCSG